MSKLIQILLGLGVFILSACSPTARALNTNSGPRPTSQVLTGFQALPRTATVTATSFIVLPSATPVLVSVPVTVTVMVQSTPVVATRVVTVTTTPVSLPTSAPTPTPTQPFVTLFASPTPEPALHCDNPLATITSPQMGEKIIWGTAIPVTGTANISNFLYWKIQYEPDATYSDPAKQDAGWGELYRSEKDPRKLAKGAPQPITNGNLMTWDTKTIQPGIYWIRLVANQIDGNYPTPCTIKVNISRY